MVQFGEILLANLGLATQEVEKGLISKNGKYILHGFDNLIVSKNHDAGTLLNNKYVCGNFIQVTRYLESIHRAKVEIYNTDKGLLIRIPRIQQNGQIYVSPIKPIFIQRAKSS